MSKERQYGQWAGNPKGHPEDKTRCIERVHHEGRMVGFHQCFNKRGYGPDGLYCKLHAEKYKDATIKVYRISYISYKIQFNDGIQKCLVTKVTDKSVWIDGHREARFSEYYKYFDTHEEAESYFRVAGEERIESCQREIDDIEKILKDL